MSSHTPGTCLNTAAPDLLAACKQLLALVEETYRGTEQGYWPSVKPIIEAGRAAIAKAEKEIPHA